MSFQRALVVIMRHHGDVLLTTPVFRALKRHVPGIEVDALIYSYAGDLLETCEHIDRIHCVDRQWKNSGMRRLISHERQLLEQLRARDYDLLVVLTDQWRSIFLSKLLRPRESIALSFAKRQRMFWKKSFSRTYPAIEHRYMVDLHLDALRCLGLPIDANDEAVELKVSAAAQEAVGNRLAQLELLDKPFVLVHPTSRGMHKCWEPEAYADVIDKLEVAGKRVVISAAPDEHEMAFVRDVLNRCDTAPADLSGQLRLMELAALIQKAERLLCVDSVPMHMAAAIGTPLLALFGPTDEQQWGPSGSRIEVLASERPCRPCLKQGCGGSGHSQCMNDLDTQSVHQQLLRL
ncbi:MAG: putative lipopolysaccharide heptosyltransferase III [Pseudomonadales bacterium]